MPSAFFKNYRVYFLTAVAYMGSLLFGYDTGVMGSVLALKSFRGDFGLPLDSTGFGGSKNAQVASNVVSLLTAGCFFGSIAAAFCNDRFGRKYSLIGFSVIFLVGAAIQTSASHSLGQIYAGRVVAGLGVGGMSSITPVFVTENAPPAIRGRITGMFQEFLVLGSTFAYWLNYGVALHIPTSTKQWRIPVAIQLIPGGFLLIGLFFLKESPRWLAKQGRYEEATASMAWTRCTTIEDEEVVQEIAEIRASIEEELAQTEGLTWKECFQPANRFRFITAFCLMFWQQFSGTNSIGYYAPQIFETVGISAANTALFATGIYGTVKVVTTAIFLITGIDTLGRRKSLIFGAAWMMSMMFILASVLVTHPPDTKSTIVSPASIAMVVIIYFFVIGYSASWGPIPWVYVSEIFPTRLRSYGVGLAASTQWLCNFSITEITPIAVSNIGWRTFLMFGFFCLGMGVWSFFIVRETKGKTLEELDILFGGIDAEQRAQDVEAVLHAKKDIVHHEGDEPLASKAGTVRVEDSATTEKTG
ncbi:quinate permease [Sclerotinia borealis F-4128]|uniref:Quinate permease n=1 Tax=Sclerotinia borealis (strain F-4128) TaxID=1432307 RepID=W9CGH2_SCLBF|nr:quinate permease [Sclerotinia borealis F-4128]